MNQTQLRIEDFSYEANSRGYMLKYKGQSIGGAGILPGASGPTSKRGTKQIQENTRYAKIDIQNIMFGNPGHYGKVIDEINNR